MDRPPPHLMTRGSIADLLGVSPLWVQREWRSGTLISVPWKHRVFSRVRDVLGFVEERLVPPDGPAEVRPDDYLREPVRLLKPEQASVLLGLGLEEMAKSREAGKLRCVSLRDTVRYRVQDLHSPIIDKVLANPHRPPGAGAEWLAFYQSFSMGFWMLAAEVLRSRSSRNP